MVVSKEISNRIAMLRPLLIIGVVFVHVPGISDQPSELVPTFFNWFAAFFKNGVFRGTVPTMSLIAGFLLFSAQLDQAPRKLFSKKFGSLVIPFFIFNVLCLLFMAAVNRFIGPAFSVLQTWPDSVPSQLALMFGFDDYPINGALHFVRDMIVTMLFVPVLGVVIRKAPWIGFAVLALVFGTDMDGQLIFRASSLLLFYIGGAAAVYRWNVLALDPYAKQCLAILAVMCLVIIGFRIDDNTVLVMAAPFLIWPAASLCNGTRLQAAAMRLSHYSFFIFAAHAPLIGLAWWYVNVHARWVPYPLVWFGLPVLICAGLIKTYDVAIKLAPRAFNIAIGARLRQRAVAERRKVQRAAGAPVYTPELRATLVKP